MASNVQSKQELSKVASHTHNDPENQMSQKTHEVVYQTMPFCSISRDKRQRLMSVVHDVGPMNFGKLIWETGHLERILSYLPVAEMVRFASFGKEMLRITKKDLLFASAFTEQLEHRSRNEIPMSHKDRQTTLGFGLCMQPLTMSASSFGKELERRVQIGIPTTHEEHVALIRHGLSERLSSTIYHLDLENARVDDDMLQKIVEIYPNLKSISLSGALITDRGLTYLKNLPFLENLNLAKCRDIQHFDFNTGFSSLKHLNLDRTTINDQELGSLVGCPFLKSLSLKGIINRSVSEQFRGDGLNTLVEAGVPLMKLDLGENHSLSDAAFRAIGQFPQLTHLSLLFTYTSDDALRLLNGLGLKDLNLAYNGRITDDGIRSLENFPLENLCLDSCIGITDVGFTSLTRFPLQTLSLEGCKITDRGLKNLSEALSLTALNLESCFSVTHQGIRSLVLLPLEKLSIKSCPQFSDDDCVILGMLPLTALNISNTRITQRGLKTLAENLSLRELNISYCKGLETYNAPDDTVVDALRLFPLRCLVVSRGIGSTSVSVLKEAIPGLEIVRS